MAESRQESSDQIGGRESDSDRGRDEDGGTDSQMDRDSVSRRFIVGRASAHCTQRQIQRGSIGPVKSLGI